MQEYKIKGCNRQSTYFLINYNITIYDCILYKSWEYMQISNNLSLTALSYELHYYNSWDRKENR